MADKQDFTDYTDWERGGESARGLAQSKAPAAQ
jgi:hypothetical protein